MNKILTALAALFIFAPVAYAQDAPCPIFESRGWHAWTDQGGEGGETRLLVAGQVDLPTPGFELVWENRPLDRMQPPSLRLRLSAIPPEGMVAQVITPTDVLHKMPSSIKEYRSVLVICGDRTLAEIVDVKPTD